MSRISVAGPSSVVTNAGVAVGEEGGSVVDVAIVASLVAMCTEPGVCGPGAGGYLTVTVPGHRPVVIDGYMALPGLGFSGEAHLVEVTMPYGGGVTTLAGAGSVAVPGAFAALEVASRMFGRLPWSELMEAAAATVEAGFPLSAPCHRYLNEGSAPIYRADPVAREALFDGEGTKAVGATVHFPGLADTLRYIGEEGAVVFYEGDLGRAIVSDLAERGGQLTREDMSSYRAVVREPLTAVAGAWRLALNPEPAIGGATIARVLDGLADPGDPVQLARALVAAFRARTAGELRSPSTISVAVADTEGGAAATSFSTGYGSGAIPRGTGMLMNNSVGELELADDRLQPGQRMLSNMAPTVARHGGDAVAVGSPGADRITTAVATTLARLASGDTLDDAIDHPRTHPEFGGYGVRLAVEPGLDLVDVGLPLRHFDEQHMYFGGVNGAGFIEGKLVAHADPRRTGSTGSTSSC